MGWQGFLTDIAVGTAVSRFVPGAKGAMLGGALGGVAGQAVDGNTGVMDLASGLGLGLLGGLGAHGLNSRVISRGLSERAETTAKALAKAEEPGNQFAAAVKGLKDAARSDIFARNALRDAEGHLAQLRASGASRREIKQAEKAVRKAQDAQKATKKARERARGQAKQDRSAARQGEAALAKAKKSDKWAQGFNNQFGNGSKLAHNWGRAGLIGLGSAGLVGAYNLWSDEPDGGDPDSGATPKTPLTWDGLDPAVAAGVMYQQPFAMDGTPAAGTGFLLRPTELNPDLVKWYGAAGNSFAASVVDNHQLFGKPDLKKPITLKDVPKLPAIGVADSQASQGASSYKQVAAGLATAAEKLTSSQEKVAESVEKVEEIQKTGRANIAALIAGVNLVMTDIPDASEVNFLTVITQAFSELISTMDDAAAANELAAQGIGEPDAAADQQAAQDLANSVGNYAGQQYNPGLTPDSSQIGLNNPWNPGNLGTSDAATPDTSALQDASERFRDQAERLSGSANTPGGVTPASFDPGSSFNPGASQLGSTDPMGGMSGLMSMLPMMMQQKAMRDMADSDMAGRIDDLDPGRFDQAAVPTLPQAQPPVGTTPWSNQAAAAANNPAATPAQPAHSPTGAPGGATSTQPGTGVPNRVPGEDGLVAYSFPDGRTQRVPLAVAQALDKAFANKSGTDAQAAYQGTAAAWADSKDIGPAVDPAELATGDIGTWIIRQPVTEPQKPMEVPAKAEGTPEIQPAAMVSVGGDTGENEEPPKDKPDTGSSDESKYRTAVLVAFGEGESGTLEAVVNGELRQFEAEMSDTEGEFGDFAGFKHPKGVEAAGTKGQDSETMATSGDQTTADIPALSMPV
ncbi:ATP synthase F0 subunit B [Nocardia sp. NPDC003963]